MKKKIFIIGLISALLISLIVLTGCEKTKQSDKESEQSSGNSIIGSWKNDDLGADYIYTFNDDGTGNYNAAGTIMEFTYTLVGDKISILYKEDTVSFDTEYKIDGDSLNIIDSIGSDTIYKKVK